jgi:predicted dehydrogenase
LEETIVKSFKWDVFISHASEDKKDVVDPLVEELKSRDIRVWYDAHALKLGDPLRASIDKGLKDSRFGVIILSPAFLRKGWPAKELEGLFALERNGRKIILPVWHKVTSKKVANYSPILANLFAVNTKDGIENVSGKIIDVIRPSLTKSKPAIVGSFGQVSPKIPIVLAGCGWWARQRTVLPLIAQNPDLYEVMAVCDIKDERSEFEKLVVPEFERRQLPVPGYYRTLPEAIRECRQKLKNKARLAVVINTPNQMHEGLARQAFEQNCHVYAERPINRRSDELVGLLKVAKDENLLLYNGVQRRLEPPFKYLFHVVEKQKNFGHLESIRCMLAAGRVVEGWRRDRRLSGGGIIIDEGYHLLDAAVWLLEAYKPDTTFAANDLDVFAKFGYGGPGTSPDIETRAFGVANLPNGITLHFDLSYDTPINSIYEMLELRDREGNRVRYVRDLIERKPTPGRLLHQLRDSSVVGDGYVDVDPNGGFTFIPDGPTSGANNTGPLRQFLRQVSEFNDQRPALSRQKRESGKNECDARFVLNTQELITAIYKHDNR